MEFRPGKYTSPKRSDRWLKEEKGPCDPIVRLLKRVGHVVEQIEDRIDPYKKYKPWKKGFRQPRGEAKEILGLIHESVLLLSSKDQNILAQEKALITRDVEPVLLNFEAIIQHQVMEPLKIIFQTDPTPTPDYRGYLNVIRDMQKNTLKALENVGIPETIEEDKELERKAEAEDLAEKTREDAREI